MMKYNDLKNVIKEVLNETNAWEEFLAKQRLAKPTKLVPWSTSPEEKDLKFDLEKGDRRIKADTEEDARKILRDMFPSTAGASGDLGRDEEGYFVRTITSTKGT